MRTVLFIWSVVYYFLKTWYKQVFFYTNVYYIGSITFVSLN